MRTIRIFSVVAAALLLAACGPQPGGGGGASTTSTTSTTTTTTAPALPDLVYTGTADKTVGCFSGVGGDDRFSVTLGSDGWWDFYFQGCGAGSSETVALWDPAGGPTGNAFQSPTGYACMMRIDGTNDYTGWLVDSIGSFGDADTGGLIFLDSTNSWASETNWTITCKDNKFPLPQP